MYSVINWLDPIKEVYDLYLEEENTLRIVEVLNDDLDFDSGLKADLYLEL